MRVKERIFAGVVCEQIVWSTGPRVRDPREARPPRPRFKSDEERARHREQMSRRKFQRLVNANFTPDSLYATLTLDDGHEVHSFGDARRIRDNYVRRLRVAWPQARLVIVCGRGKNTQRIHYHMLCDGVPEQEILRLWGQGEITRVEHLRSHVHYDGIDHGADYTGLANYLFDHWTPEQGGHRWKATRNLREPEREAPREVKANYRPSRPPKPPAGYLYIGSHSTPYGCAIYTYIREPAKESRKRR